MWANPLVNGPDQQVGQDLPFTGRIRKSLERFVHYILSINGGKDSIVSARTVKIVKIFPDLLAVIQILKHFHCIWVISDTAELELDSWASVSKEEGGKRAGRLCDLVRTIF